MRSKRGQFILIATTVLALGAGIAAGLLASRLPLSSSASDSNVDAIGRTPRGKGLLGAVVLASRPIRLRDVREHGAFGGLPVHHPELTSFLGVPMQYSGQQRGSLYVANKRVGAEFSEEDQALVEMLRAGLETRKNLALGSVDLALAAGYPLERGAP